MDVAKRLLGQLTDRAGFDELFGVVFPEDSDVSLDDMKDVLNSLQRTDIAIQITCNPTDQAYQALQFLLDYLSGAFAMAVLLTSKYWII